MLKPLPSDIPDPEGEVHAPTVFKQLEECAFVFAATLEGGETLLPSGAVHLVAHQIRAHLNTHGSIVLLTSKHDERPELLADAVSLLREQIERVFVVTRLLVEPDVWYERYSRDDVARTFRYHLAEAVERQHLPRFSHFFEVILPEALERQAREVNLTPLQVQRLVFEAQNPGEPEALPKELKSDEHAIRGFPTPGAVLKAFKSTRHPAAPVLARWHVEYSKRSGHSHLGLDKLLHSRQQTPDTRGADDPRRIIEDLAIREVHMISWLALLSVLTETFDAAKAGLAPDRHVDLLLRLARAWDVVLPTSLTALAIWELRAKALLPAASA